MLKHKPLKQLLTHFNDLKKYFFAQRDNIKVLSAEESRDQNNDGHHIKTGGAR